MNLTLLLTALDWLRKHWKLALSLTVLLTLAVGIWSMRHTIRKQASVILQQQVDKAELQTQLASAHGAIDLANQALRDFEAQTKRADKRAKRADAVARELQARAREAQLEMTVLRSRNGNCDAVLIELGKQLGGVQWRE